MSSAVLDNELCLLRQVRGMEGHEPGQRRGGLALGQHEVLAAQTIGEPIVRLVGRLGGEDIDDELLLDGLMHRVQVERDVPLICHV